MMPNAVELLQQLGFGDYEARAYVALLQRQPLNGYELAKLSGIPRANIYSILQKLEERAAVIRQETPDSTRFAPIPPCELLQRLNDHFQGTRDEALRALDEVTSPAEHEYVWNVQGYPATLEHTRALLETTQKELLLAIWPQEAVAIAPNVARAEAREVVTTTLCLAACAEKCDYCRGHFYRYQAVPKQNTRWLILVSDGAEMLASEIGPSNQTVTIRTHQQLPVDLAEGYIRHSIALAAVLDDLGQHCGSRLTPETLAVLAATKPFGRNNNGLSGTVLTP